MNFSFSRQKYCEQNKPLKKLYLYAVSRTIVEKLIERMDFNVEITRNVDDADIVIAHKKTLQKAELKFSTQQKNTEFRYSMLKQTQWLKFKKY